MLTQTRRALPPGIEDDIVFGIMWIRVGAYKTLKPAANGSHKVSIQFWGESSAAELFTSQTNPQTQEYEVKCPVTYFQKYLRDMKRNLKIQVQNIGIVAIDLTNYLKKNIQLTSKVVFEHFKGFFEVVGKNNKKVGSLQLEICSNFNPAIALRQLSQEIHQNPKPICEVQKTKLCQCTGQCKCKIDKITALDVIAVEKPELFNEFYEQCKIKVSPKANVSPNNFLLDQRIPNSLNLQPNKSPFDAKKYAELIDKQPIVNQIHSKKKAIGELVAQGPKHGSKFPSVQRILTYSNLRIKKQSIDEMVQVSEHKLQQPKSKKIDNNQYPSLKNNIQSKHEVNFIERQSLPRETEHLKYQQQNIGINRPGQKERKPTLLPQSEQRETFGIQNIKADVSLSRVSDVKQVDNSASVDIQRDILSRVVHLNDELERQSKVSPKKAPLHQMQPPHYIQTSFKNQFVSANFIQPMPPMVSKKKGSTMLLNMIFEIHTKSIKLGKQGRFYISYRPYGQKQHQKLGPQFQPTITLMSPVGQAQVKKMNKIPFILEFWSSTTNQLLGISKISLTKIEKGFILDGRLNEIAIKTSLLPTVIHKGTITIITLLDQPIGQCYLEAHIGTTSQIQSYLNSPKPNKQFQAIERQPQKEDLKPIDKKIQKEKQKIQQGNIQDLTSLLQLVDSNPNPMTFQALLSFMNLKTASINQFQELLEKLAFKGGNPFKILTQKETLQCKQLALCHQDYKKARQGFNEYIQNHLGALPVLTLNSLIKKVKNVSNFGVINKKQLKQSFQTISLLIWQSLPQLIQQDSYLQLLGSRGKRPLKQLIFTSYNMLTSTIAQMILSQGAQISQQLQLLMSSAKGSTSIPLQLLTKSILKKDGGRFSRWAWILLLKNIYQSFGQKFQFPGQGEVNIVLVYNWFAQKIKEQKQTANQYRENLEQQQKEQLQQYKQTTKNKDQLIIEPIVNLLHNESSNKDLSAEKQNKPENKEISKQPAFEKPYQQQKQKNIEINNYFQHKFVITLQQLYTSGQQIGQCQVAYKFPFEQHQIISKKVQLLRDRCKYKLISQGVHKFTINQPIELYLGQNTLNFRIQINEHSSLFADLHPDELLSLGTSSKVVPIFSTDKEGMAGKLKLKIEYSKKQSQATVLSRQTTQDIFLPKNGFINYELSTTVEQTKIRQMFNLKQDFYLQIVLDLFGQSKPLSPHYPPLHSNLNSDFSYPSIISGSYKVSLNPQVLQHLRGGSWAARILLIYYSKQRGNYQKKQVVIASLNAPLLSAIREEGIAGDYAFKNKLGMFVSLAHAKIKYQKTAKTLINQPQTNKEYSRENIWIVLDFAQIINFQGDLNWVKFQIINQGKRYTTQKSSIRDCGFFNLQKRCLMLHLNYQDFYSMKIVPIKVVTAHQQFGIDLNLRNIAKNLSRQKFTVDSHYFIALDERTQPIKLRVGLKVYVFRGPAQLSGFIDALNLNTIRSVVDIIQKEDDYNNLIQGLKQQLKLSHKSIDQFLSIALDRRRKQRLPRSFFTSTIEPTLDTSPILCSSAGDVQALGQQLRSQITLEQLSEYLEQTGVVLQNFRGELLQRYKFVKLNENKIDQNVEYLGLHQQIDLLVLLRKIKVQAKIQHNKLPAQNQFKYKHIRLSITKGYNFHLLYNGIKPNCMVKIPQFGLESQVIQRTSEPIFNQHINIDLTAQNRLKNINIQVYHVPSDHSQEIMIGQGTLTITQSLKNQEVPNSKLYRAVINSLMSNRQQASLDIKVQILSKKQEGHNQQHEEEIQDQDSIRDSVIQDAMQRIKRVNGVQKKAMLFQSSDQD